MRFSPTPACPLRSRSPAGPCWRSAATSQACKNKTVELLLHSCYRFNKDKKPTATGASPGSVGNAVIEKDRAVDLQRLGVIGAQTVEAAVANRRHPAQIGHLTSPLLLPAARSNNHCHISHPNGPSGRVPASSTPNWGSRLRLTHIYSRAARWRGVVNWIPPRNNVLPSGIKIKQQVETVHLYTSWHCIKRCQKGWMALWKFSPHPTLITLCLYNVKAGMEKSKKKKKKKDIQASIEVGSTANKHAEH